MGQPEKGSIGDLARYRIEIHCHKRESRGTNYDRKRTDRTDRNVLFKSAKRVDATTPIYKIRVKKGTQRRSIPQSVSGAILSCSSI